MRCERFSHTENGVYSEWCELSLTYSEVRTVISALEYYTDKRKLNFTERMQSGDMARVIKGCKIIEEV